MRILNLIQCANLGGMEQASLRLMKALQARGHELSLISLNPIDGLGPLLAASSIPAQGLDYSGRGKVAFFRTLRRIIATQTADALILTGHNFTATLALGDLCKGRRLMAMHFHHEGVMPAWRWRLIYRAAKAQFQTITFPSDYVREEAEALYPPIRSISETIRNPLELPAPVTPGAREAFRAAFRIPADAPLIGNAGWLIQRKRFDVFLETAAKILRHTPDAYFIIAGDGELRDSLEYLADSLGLAGRIRWTGWLSDLSPFYASIDVLLFNSDWDAFPTTPVEAMSHGVPVVASCQRGGLGEILDSSCGWLLDHHDPEALSRAVSAALSSEGRTCATAGRARVSALCHPESIARKVELKLFGVHYAEAS